MLVILLISGQIAASAQFTSGVAVVEVYATVTDTAGEPVTGLTASDFVVEEDGRPQQVSVFSAGDLPLALAIAVDRSFSVSRQTLAAAASSAGAMVAGLRPEDEVTVLAIGSTTDIVAPLSRDHQAAADAVRGLQPWGTTPLYDAAVEAIDAIQAATGRRALILLSDGNDRYSQTSASDLLAHARRSDVQIYPIALARSRPTVFSELASATGGRSLQAVDGKGLSAALTAIARELRSQYLLGYTPTAADSERREWRTIRVRVSRPGVQVRARDGYFSR
jgi:Ca-activated chloride channel family protein